jgi:hypothetical protein
VKLVLPNAKLAQAKTLVKVVSHLILKTIISKLEKVVSQFVIQNITLDKIPMETMSVLYVLVVKLVIQSQLIVLLVLTIPTKTVLYVKHLVPEVITLMMT